MDIAALASVMKHSQIQQSVSLAVARMALDQGEVQSQELVRMMEASINPHVGQVIDLHL